MLGLPAGIWAVCVLNAQDLAKLMFEEGCWNDLLMCTGWVCPLVAQSPEQL